MNTFGVKLRLTTFGESHGIAIGGILDSFPAGVKIDFDFLQNELDKIGITLNKNMIPNDKKSPKETSGVRIGTAPMTTRGYLEEDFVSVARRIDSKIKEMSNVR